MSKLLISDDEMIMTAHAFCENQAIRLGFGTTIDNVHDKSIEETSELLEVCIAIKKNVKMYRLNAISEDVYNERSKELYLKFIEEYAHTMIFIGCLGERMGDLYAGTTKPGKFNDDVNGMINSKLEFLRKVIKDDKLIAY